MMLRHLRFAAGFAALTLAAAPIAATAGPLVPARSPEEVGFDTGRIKALDAYMQKVVADGRVAGMTTLLARHGKIVEFNTYGKASIAKNTPMAKDAIFRVYSMTKPMTGVAMMILFEQGKWRLDDPVTKFVPEFKNLRVMTGVGPDGKTMVTEEARRPPTMREIMSHTAGFGYGLADVNPVDKMYREKKVLGGTMKEMIDRTATIPLMYQPGTNWSYSNAVDIQGSIIERISGQTLGQFMQQNIFTPLKMTDTGFYTRAGTEGRLAALYAGKKGGGIEEPTDMFGGMSAVPDYTKPPMMESGGGGLVSTTMDYARFCQMLANKGELDGVRIISPASVELMDTNVIPKNVLVSSNGTSVARFNEAVGFGLDFMVVNDPRVAGSLEGKNTMSWGGAAGTWFWVDPTNDVIFVGMIQRMGGTGGDDLGAAARTLTYQALTHPER